MLVARWMELRMVRWTELRVVGWTVRPVDGSWGLPGVGTGLFLLFFNLLNVIMRTTTGRGVCIGDRIAARVIVPRGVGLISVSAAGVVNGRYTSGVIHVGPCLRRSSIGATFYRGRLLNAVALVKRHRVTRCSIICARCPDVTTSVFRMTCDSARSCVGPRISVPGTRVIHCT